MKFHSLRTSLLGSAFMLVGALLLGSCGGGGATPSFTGGNLLLLPLTGTFYAGMPATMTVQGGAHPYRLVSSQPGILPVPSEINASSFTVIPNNPGVIDTGIAVGELPVRSVIISVSDQTGGFNTSTIQVAQNFLTGYGVFYQSNCPAANGGTPPSACAGGETAIRIEANFNGALISNRTFRLDILRGPFQWVFSPGGPIAGNSITVVTDHEGKTNAFFRVTNSVATQLGLFRITDVATGVSTEQVFTITGTSITNELVILPDEFTFTGPDSATCGSGQADFLVFDGIPPYTAVSSFSNVTVTPTTTSSQPGRFTLSVGGGCVENATIIVTDSNNARGTVTVTTEVGTGDPATPVTPLRAVPTSVTLTCGQSANVLFAGGDDPTAIINAVSTDPDVTVIGGTGRTIQISRNNVGGNTAVPPIVNSQVTATDGSQTVNITVRNPTDCVPP